jgi:hypothetical protein
MAHHGDEFGTSGLGREFEAAKSTSSSTTFPARRALKTSPKPWSKISSDEVRESRQLTMAAKGFCPPLVSRASASKSRRIPKPEANRSLPAFRKAKASSGVDGFLLDGSAMVVAAWS